MPQNIVIYQDEGVDPFTFTCLLDFFKDDYVRLADANAVIQGSALEDADAFVMPGGADLHYCRKLNGIGNANIRSYVENGGTYLGICGGAYYGCKEIEFHKGREDEICGPRELEFVDGCAVGTILELAPPFDDLISCAVITNVNNIPVFYSGGPYFRSHAQVMAQYNALKLPAIVRQKIGKGRAILSGVHFEVSTKNLENYAASDDSEKQIALELAAKLRYAPPFDWKTFLLGVKE